MAKQDICPHVDSIGEITKEDLLLKAKVCLFLPHTDFFADCYSKIAPVSDTCIVIYPIHIPHTASVTKLLCNCMILLWMIVH